MKKKKEKCARCGDTATVLSLRGRPMCSSCGAEVYLACLQGAWGPVVMDANMVTWTVENEAQFRKTLRTFKTTKQRQKERAKG